MMWWWWFEFEGLGFRPVEFDVRKKFKIKFSAGLGHNGVRVQAVALQSPILRGVHVGASRRERGALGRGRRPVKARDIGQRLAAIWRWAPRRREGRFADCSRFMARKRLDTYLSFLSREAASVRVRNEKWVLF